MIRVTLIIVILSSLLFGSCTGRRNKLDRNDLIPETELVSILTDVYIADGLLSITKIHYWFSSLDTLTSYFHIIEKYGYSKQTMDKTLNYYFTKNPRKLIKIYDKVLGILSEMESIVEREEVLAEVHLENLWTGKEFYSFPDPSGTDSASFDIKLNKTGLYRFSFSATLFPDDQSVNPRITAYLCHSDSIDTGTREYIKAINYIKDGQTHNYTYIIKVPGNTTLHFRGWLYDFDNHPDEWAKHVRFSNITLVHIRAYV